MSETEDIPAIDVVFDRPGLATRREPLVRYTKSLLATCLREHDRALAAITVLYCSPERMQRLNLEFRQLDRPTDVLSFPDSEDATGPYLGDLAICLAVADHNASENEKPLVEELALLLVHGYLHLAGYNHDTPEEEDVMWRETDRLLSACAALPRPRITLRAPHAP